MKVFIDGREGTTGLRIYDRLRQRGDVSLIVLPDSSRKDPSCRKDAINESDVTFLCLPDTAAMEAVALCENPNTVILDASTAHRTDPGWAYGFPELSPSHFDAVQSGKRIAVPGCHASGFIALIYPLIAAGLLGPEAQLTCMSLTGYSGGGKKMIAQYEAENRSPLLDAPRLYGLTQSHKHLKEMQRIPGLITPPMFCPVVSDFYEGMLVTVPLFAADLRGSAEDVKAVYQALYAGPVTRYLESPDEEGFLSAIALAGTDRMEVSVLGSEDRILVAARFGNLGKGASGAAIQCMNIARELDSTLGLDL